MQPVNHFRPGGIAWDGSHPIRHSVQVSICTCCSLYGCSTASQPYIGDAVATSVYGKSLGTNPSEGPFAVHLRLFLPSCGKFVFDFLQRVQASDGKLVC